MKLNARSLRELLSAEQYQLAQREQERYEIPLISIIKRLDLVPNLDEWVSRVYHAKWLDTIPEHNSFVLFKGSYAFLKDDYIALILIDPADFTKRDQAIAAVQEKWNLPIQLYWTDPSEIFRRTPHEDFLINLLVKTFHASDLHAHRFANFVDIKIRVDGWLTSYCTFTKEEWDRFHNRLKIMACLDIAESRRPQSGHIEIVLCGHLVDLRVSTHPTIHGENLVIRFLDKHKGLRTLETLGFLSSQVNILKSFTHYPYGLIILCGPTGSGKTTTLYSLLSEFDTKRYHIATLEDPVEYQLHGISQTEIQQGLLDYGEGIRSLLRQDPDVMLIGEIRDEDTARMAFRASLTGHLVLTTLHVPHALACRDRLLNFGVPSFEIEHYLKAVVAQRLVRKICIFCKEQGCTHCNHTGYKGRTVLAEIWKPHEDAFFTMQDHAKVLVENNVVSKEEITQVVPRSHS